MSGARCAGCGEMPDSRLRRWSRFHWGSARRPPSSPSSKRSCLLGAFAALAVVLAAVGIYGVLAYVVSQRTRDIGVRLAIGADRSQVLGMVLRQGFSLVAIGIVSGLVGAFVLTRLMQRLLYGVGPKDPSTFVAATAGLLLVAVFATALPAWRASRVNPLVVLRRE